MSARLLATCLFALPAFGLTAQEARGPRLHFGAGVAGQREGDRDLSSGGFTADLGVAWLIRPALRARLSAPFSRLRDRPPVINLDARREARCGPHRV
jgi:hypothetical protein